MTSLTGGTKTVRKNMNRSIILRLIRDAHRISRTDIAARLGLTKSTVTAIVSGLIEEGIVLEYHTGESAPSGGRKPVFLGINNSFGCVLGIDVGVDNVRGVLVDLGGTVLSTNTIPGTADASKTLDVCSELHGSMVGESENLRLIGVGVGFPGYVDPFSGIILHSVALNMQNEPFSQPLCQRLHVPVIVDNDANCCAWGELVTRGPSGLEDFLFVLPKLNRTSDIASRILGIGIGVVMDGAVRYGHGFSSGEIHSAFWRTGNKEQLECLSQSQDIETDDALFKRAVVELLDSLSVAASVINPGKIYLGGYFGKRFDEVTDILAGDMNNRFIGESGGVGMFAKADFDENDVARGASLMFLERLFGLPDYHIGRSFPQLDWERIARNFSKAG